MDVILLHRLFFLLLLLLSSLAAAQEGERRAASGASEAGHAGHAVNPFVQILAPAMTMPLKELSRDDLQVHDLKASHRLTATIDLTAEPDDLWWRLRHGFAMPDLTGSLVLHYQQWYQNRPDALRRMVERAQPYLHHIIEEIELRGMPTELALLPMVESSFNPLARSPAQAEGLWQFIPATGKRFNLEQNWWQDQRRDFVASTEAALDYLMAIYELHGDWQLALASYNWGEGAVKRAIDRNQQRGLPTDYQSLSMPEETRHYLPKLQALKNIFNDPSLMLQLGIPALRNQVYFQTVSLSRPIDAKLLASLADLTLDEFYNLNPAHKRPLIREGTSVILPVDKVATFESRLASYSGPLTEWQAYKLQPGERLDKLAPKFGISLSDLKRVNGLEGGLKLPPGASVLLPREETQAEVASQIAEWPAFRQPVLPLARKQRPVAVRLLPQKVLKAPRAEKVGKTVPSRPSKAVKKRS